MIVTVQVILLNVVNGKEDTEGNNAGGSSKVDKEMNDPSARSDWEAW
jgi:hypothetical protein